MTGRTRPVDPPRPHRDRGAAGPSWRAAAIAFVAVLPMVSYGDPPLPAPNYDESAVGDVDLPDPLHGPDGAIVTTPEAWRGTARPHQLELLEAHVYGRRLPPLPVTVPDGVERVAVTLADGVAATRIQAPLRLGDGAAARVVDVLLYLPRVPSREAAAGGPGRGAAGVPVFLELNFRGNHAQHGDPGIRLSTSWMPKDDAAGIVDHRATEASRGGNSRRWPVEPLVSRGFGMATAYCGDIFPDRADGRPDSVLVALGRPVDGALPPDEPGAIGAWAWGLSRILDWLVTLPEVDPRRVVVVGHSRLGKTALWAGACDERFAMVVSNNSGCGGAALSRRNFGETVGVITRRFPHWFCPAFAAYAGRERELPCDQHTLLAMTAPRPLYVSSATEDLWADPRGEFLAAVAASRVWKLFGLEGLRASDPPQPDVSIGDRVGYHSRTGAHDILLADWTFFADFALRTIPAAD